MSFRRRLEETRRSGHHAVRALAMVWRASAPLTAALGSMTLIAALIPPAVAWAGKRIVDGVVARNVDGVIKWVAVEFGLVASQTIVGRALSFVTQVLGLRLGIHVNVAILEKAVDLSLPAFEDSELYDAMTKARREASTRPLQLVRESFALIQSLVTLAGYATLLLRFSVWGVLLLLIATFPATAAEMHASSLTFQLRNRRSQEWRRLTYLEQVLATDEHAKEVKLFGLGEPLLDRYRSLAWRLFAEDRRVALRRSLGQLLSLVATTAFYGAYVVVALAAAWGRISIGNLTLYVVAFRQGQAAFQAMLASLGAMYEQNLYMANLFDFLEAGEPSAGAGMRWRLPPPTTANNGEIPWLHEKTAVAAGTRDSGADNGIALEHVSFRYPGKSEWALRDITFEIPQGSSVALVGENGAGKTTLVKLITRLYEPTEGRVLLDGRDLRDWDERALRSRFGVLFQDFNHYQLTVRDNVGLGSVEHIDDEARIARATSEGGSNDVISGLPRGLDTQLGHWFKDGVELSGGQWQRIALSRAFMREESDILVLDEPTASLDVDAEHQVFESFRALARGRTTIIVSHRFPAVRRADRIVVLGSGAVVEQGTHDALIAKGGRYARMFELQAKDYR